MAKRNLANGRFSFGRDRRIVALARRSLVDRMIDGLVVLDSRNLVLDINSMARKIFGNTILRAAGQQAEVVFNSFPDVLDNLRHQSRKNQDVHIRIGEDDHYYLMNINPLMDRKGRTVGKMMVFQDITPLKITEIKLVEAKARAEQADNLKTAFLANMSHEIRTPMNAIIGFSNLLNDAGVSDEERNEFIGHIRNSGNSLLQLIDDIIDISRLDAGQITLDYSRLSLTRLMAELFAWFNENLQEEGKGEVQLLVSGISDSVDCSVMADVGKVNRIMRHLLANSVKFTSKGFIEFGFRMEGQDKMLLFVQDSGIGIAREKQGMIFERFSRVMTGTSQDYGGTGMGLAICKGLTELMGGTIWVESNLGVGSTFFVELPVSQIEEHPIAESMARAVSRMTPSSLVVQEPPEEPGLIGGSGLAGSPLRQDNWVTRVILVIEEEEMVYLNIEMILRPTRVNLVWARNMSEAINCLGNRNPLAAVILSTQLQDTQTEESVTKLLGAQPGIPVVAIVALADSPDGRSCLELGCTATITKPIMPASLLQALSPHLS